MARRDPDAPAGWDVQIKGVWTPVPANIRATQCGGSGVEQPIGDYRPHPAGHAVIWLVGGTLFCWSPPSGGI